MANILSLFKFKMLGRPFPPMKVPSQICGCIHIYEYIHITYAGISVNNIT